MATLARAKAENAKLRASTKRANEQRRKAFQHETVPDVSNDLAPYSSLPVSEDVIASKEVTYEEGWTYKTRRTSVAPLDPHQALQLDADAPEVHSPPIARRRSSIRRSSLMRSVSPTSRTSRSRSQSPRRQPADTILEDTSFPIEARFAVWCKANFKPLLDALTLEDTRTMGELPIDKVMQIVSALKPPFTPEEVESCVKATMEGELSADGKLDYDRWTHRQKMTAMKEENRVRRSSLPSIPIHLPPVPKDAPRQVDFVTLPAVREKVKTTKQRVEARKAKEEMDRTLAQLERVAFHKVKSKSSREKLEKAYVTYSGSPRKARSALKQFSKSRRSPRKTKKQQRDDYDDSTARNRTQSPSSLQSRGRSRRARGRGDCGNENEKGKGAMQTDKPAAANGEAGAHNKKNEEKPAQGETEDVPTSTT